MNCWKIVSNSQKKQPVIRKIIEKSPLHYSLARNMECLVPTFFTEKKVKSKKMFETH